VRVSVLAGCLAATVTVALCAPSPSALEDARIDRERVLRAADKLDFLTGQLESLQADISKLRSETDALKSENEQLKRSLQDLSASQAADRQKLLDEVSQIVAKSVPAKKQTAAPAAPQTGGTPAEQEKGYKHIVEKGQTVSAIARAFNAQGIKVSADDIIRANNLGAGAVVRPGQEIFIPKKD